MATIGSLVVNLLANYSGLTKGLDAGRQALRQFGDYASSAVSGVAGLFGAGTLGAGVGFGVKLAAEAEQASIAFTTLLGSAGAAKDLLQELTQFAAETPFEIPELRNAARSLVAFQVDASQVLPTLRAIGDISSGIAQPIGEIAELYGKAKVQGRLFAQDINQLTGRGIPIIQELAKQFGVSESAVHDLVESGQVEFKHLQQAFADLTGEGGMFHNLMAAQAVSLAGMWSNLKDSISQSLTQIGTAFLPLLKSTIDWSKQILMLVGAIGAARAALWAITAAQRAYAAAAAFSLALTGPAGWAQLAVGLAAAGAAVVTINAALGGTASAGTNAEKSVSGVHSALSKIEDLKGGVTSSNAQLDAMAEKFRLLSDVIEPGSKLAKTFAADIDSMFAGLTKGLDAMSATRQKIDEARDALAKVDALEADLGVDRANALRAVFTGMIGDLSGVNRQIADARKKLEELRAANPVEAARAAAMDAGALPAQYDELAAVLGRVEQQTQQNSAVDQLAKVREELAQLEQGLSDADVQARKFELAGVTPEVIQQYRDAAEALAGVKHQQELAAKGKTLKESLETPAEQAARKIKDLQELLRAGAIDVATFDRAYADIQKKGNPQAEIKHQLAGAVDLNSSAGFSALQQGLSMLKGNTMGDVAKQQLQVLQDIRAELADAAPSFPAMEAPGMAIAQAALPPVLPEASTVTDPTTGFFGSMALPEMRLPQPDLSVTAPAGPATEERGSAGMGDTAKLEEIDREQLLTMRRVAAAVEKRNDSDNRIPVRV